MRFEINGNVPVLHRWRARGPDPGTRLDEAGSSPASHGLDHRGETVCTPTSRSGAARSSPARLGSIVVTLRVVVGRAGRRHARRSSCDQLPILCGHNRED